MRFHSKVLASSVLFGSTTPAFATSGQIGPQGTQFAGQAGQQAIFGYLGGPTDVSYATGISMQAMFTGTASLAAASGGMGTFNLMGSNTNERPMFTVIASSVISTTGSYLFKDNSPWYKYSDFQFIPNSLFSSTGIMTVNFTKKGIF